MTGKGTNHDGAMLDDRSLDRLRRAIVVQRKRGIRRLLANPWRQSRSRILERLCRRHASVTERAATTFWGERMHVLYPERISMEIDRYGFFEEEVTRCLIDRLRPGMVFFDVGAHLGFFSMLAARLVGREGHVHTFEPTPSTFNALARNLGGRQNVTLVNAAASDADGELQFRDFGTILSAFNSLHEGKIEDADRDEAKSTGRTVRVLTRSLDSYVEEFGGVPDLLKVDTEGAELDVIHGMERLLAGGFGRRPSLTLEVGDSGAAPGDSPSRRVVDAMLARGYQPLEFSRDRWIPHQPLDRYRYTNLLFVPS